MNIKTAKNKVFGFKYLLDNLPICSEIGKQLIDKSIWHSSLDIKALEKEFERTETMISFLLRIQEKSSDNCINTDTGIAQNIVLQRQTSSVLLYWQRLSDLEPTFSQIEKGIFAPDDIQLFELKNFLLPLSLFSEWCVNTGVSAHIPADMNMVLDILDPLQERLPSFYIYDAYSSSLAPLRKKIKHCIDNEKNGSEYLALEEELFNLEHQIRTDISLKLRPHVNVLREIQNTLAYWDLLRAKAQWSIDFNMSKPTLLCDAAAANGTASAADAARLDCTHTVGAVPAANGTAPAAAPARLDCTHTVGAVSAANGTAPAAANNTAANNELAEDRALANTFPLGLSHTALFFPPLKEILEKKGRKYQDIDICLYKNSCLLTGANMSGKTILIKSLYLAQCLCQLGFFVPSKASELYLFDDVFCMTGDEQNEAGGLSSFGAEMLTLDYILKSLINGRKILFLSDEMARTTNPTEGRAIVNAFFDFWSTLRSNIPSCTESVSLISTHYDYILSAPRRIRVKGLDTEAWKKHSLNNNSALGVESLQNFMNYDIEEVLPGSEPDSEALDVASCLGVEPTFIEMAKKHILRNS